MIETKIDNAPDDLRIVNPFAALRAHATSTPLDAMDSATHAHWPWPLVLVAHVQRWRDQVRRAATATAAAAVMRRQCSQHGGKLPTSRDEKKQFKQSVRELARNDHEENLLEAFNMAHVAYAEYRVRRASCVVRCR